MTTSTVTLTTEIGVYFHGKRKLTPIVDTEVHVQTVISTFTRTTEITPTPTWQTVTITPTVAPPLPSPASPSPAQINALLAKRRNVQERETPVRLIETNDNPKLEVPRSITGVKAEIVEIPKAFNSFDSLQKYIQHIQKAKSGETASIIAEPLISIPSTSISTLYLSGTVPGEFSTSLITISLDHQGNPVDRRKRQIVPSKPQPLVVTQLAELDKETLEDLSEIEILGSVRVDTDIITNTRDTAHCSDKVVTVTVTKSIPCLP